MTTIAAAASFLAVVATTSASVAWLVAYLASRRPPPKQPERTSSAGTPLPNNIIERSPPPSTTTLRDDDIIIRFHSVAMSAMQHLALLVVDCQPVYWDDQKAVRTSFPALPRRVASLLERARRVLSPPQIVHVRANYTFRFAQNFKRLNPDKPLPSDIEAVSWAGSKVGELIVVKNSFDSFRETRLEAYLRDLGVTDIVVCGLLTSCCVLFTAQSAFASGFRVKLYEPGCADRSVLRHDQTLENYGSYCFEIVRDLDDCIVKHPHIVNSVVSRSSRGSDEDRIIQLGPPSTRTSDDDDDDDDARRDF
ncbi:hypothetical protein CTAYLR_002728 [Chrysophaeum taylorii]|uniref:Isochorismatase-like domain-containing protein n=1 Tax=Chrysophaeum taylorii TaxID=2483200 RepID=A0AAD7UCP9_9STRA|nr:hypothetical protein CTAYLR_002728 [Chrysophaeum taylorii]